MAKNIITSIKIDDHSPEVLAAVKRTLHAALLGCGLQAVRNANIEIEKSPERVDTGLLKNSITYAMGGEAPMISSYRADNPSKYSNSGKIPSGSYSGTAPNEENTVFVGTNVEYGIYVHEGTRRMTANRFLRNAIQGHESDYENIVKTAFNHLH